MIIARRLKTINEITFITIKVQKHVCMYDNRRLFPIHMPDCVNCTQDINMHVTFYI